jgi:ribose 5-phosphate isomerase B
MKVYISADHAGFELKKKIIGYLKDQHYQTVDLGPKKYNPKDDYPDFAFKMGEKTAQNKNSRGILICRSGIGMSIAANKVKGIRAALCMEELQAEKAREHNNANVLVLAADFINFKEMKKIIKKFLETEFSGEKRHIRRLAKIRAYENSSPKKIN